MKDFGGLTIGLALGLVFVWPFHASMLFVLASWLIWSTET